MDEVFNQRVERIQSVVYDYDMYKVRCLFNALLDCVLNDYIVGSMLTCALRWLF